MPQENTVEDEKIKAKVEAGVMIDPALDFHDQGCIKRYGAISDDPTAQCECEKRRDTAAKP
jgi:hypothetical protein